MTDKPLAIVQGTADAYLEADRIEREAAFERLYEFASPKIYGYVRCQVPNPETARDLVSRVFLKAYRHRGRAPAGPAAMQWLLRIATTTLIDYWRVEGRWEAARVSLDELGDLPASVTSPESACFSKERAALLLRMLGQLNEQDRVLLALKFTAQRTNREIATILNLSEAAVSMRLLRALRRLRQRLQECGL